jgi:hypothetical protein
VSGSIAAGGGRTRLYLVDPDGGSLQVLANGGRGGSGGAGNPPGRSGADGTDGLSGFPGRDGAAGAITVTLDPTALRYQSRLELINRSGAGKAGAAPVTSVQPVGALW